MDEAIRYRLDIVGVSSAKRRGNGTLVLNKRWQLFYSGVDPALHAQAGVGILTNPRLAERVVEWRPISERVALLRLKLKEKALALVQVYAPNMESEYAPFLDEILGVLEGIPGTDSIVLLGDFNTHVENDAQTWKCVIGKNGDSDINAQGRLLLDFFARWRLVHNEYVLPSQRYPQIHLVQVGRFGNPKVADRSVCCIR